MTITVSFYLMETSKFAQMHKTEQNKTKTLTKNRQKLNEISILL